MDKDLYADGSPREHPQRDVPEYLHLMFRLLLPLQLSITDSRNDGSGWNNILAEYPEVDLSKPFDEQDSSNFLSKSDEDDPKLCGRCKDEVLVGHPKNSRFASGVRNVVEQLTLWSPYHTTLP